MSLLDRLVDSAMECAEQAALERVTKKEFTNKEELSKDMVEIFDYNPMTHFNEGRINDELNSIIMNNNDIKDVITEKRQDIVTDALKLFDETEEDLINNITVKVVGDYTGRIETNKIIDLDEAIQLTSYTDDDFIDDDEKDENDYDDDDEDSDYDGRDDEEDDFI